MGYRIRHLKSFVTIFAVLAFAFLLCVVYVYFAYRRVCVTGAKASGHTVDYFVAPQDGAIVRAVFEGDAARVKELLASGANPNAVIEDLEFGTVVYWEKPIHWAAEEGDSALLEVLIEGGADPNSRDQDGATPLMKLARLRSEDVLFACVDALCRAGANPDLRDRDGDRPVLDTGSAALHLAATWGNTKLAELLLQRGANIDSLDGTARTPLLVACACFPSTHCESILETLVCHSELVGARPARENVSRHSEERRLFGGGPEARSVEQGSRRRRRQNEARRSGGRR